MKKIALVLPEAGPVPAVRGGAIEELLTILVEQNEIEHRVQFIVFCAVSYTHLTLPTKLEV